MNISPTELIVHTLMDHAEQHQNLYPVKTKICELEDSLRNIVTPEAWDLIMKWDEEAAHFRFMLVLNVLTSIGVTTTNECKACAPRPIHLTVEQQNTPA